MLKKLSTKNTPKGLSSFMEPNWCAVWRYVKTITT